MRIISRIGLGLVIAASASWSGWTFWSSTRKWVPANVPILLAKSVRTQTDEFAVNVTGPYEIVVEADKSSSIPFNQLACSIGAGAIWPEKKCANPSVLKCLGS